MSGISFITLTTIESKYAEIPALSWPGPAPLLHARGELATPGPERGPRAGLGGKPEGPAAGGTEGRFAKLYGPGEGAPGEPRGEAGGEARGEAGGEARGEARGEGWRDKEDKATLPGDTEGAERKQDWEKPAALTDNIHPAAPRLW